MVINMCRLFGLHAGRSVVTATFLLLDAPNNLSAQSTRNPDGTGLGVFNGNASRCTSADARKIRGWGLGIVWLWAFS
jgi:predicted glutamine amidotransferase